MNTVHFIHLLDLFGVAVFAVSGSLAAGVKRMDIFGVVVLGLVTALGGGTIRDALLGSGPVFWVLAPHYLLVAVFFSVLTFIIVRILTLPRRALLISDAFGLAVFTAIGTARTLAVSDSLSVAMVMGVMTGAAGGMIRDVLSAEVPLVLRKEIYATAALCGSFVYLVTARAGMNALACLAVSVAATLSIRLAAIHWHLSLPVFQSREEQEGKKKT